MGLLKGFAGLNGVDRAAERIIQEIEQRKARGEREFWVSYTQKEIGMRNSATQLASLVRRKIEKAGYEIVDGEGGSFGDDVRLLIRCG
jgi:hypothetical protein